MATIEKVKFSDLCHPTIKQVEAFQLTDKYKFLLYGGAMGGGKSYWIRWALLRFLLKQYSKTKKEGIRVGLFCEDYPALKDRHLSKIRFEFPEWLGTLKLGDSEFHLKKEYGSGVIAFRNLDDVSKYQSAEFAAIGIDEITKNTKEVFDYLRTRLRWPGIVDVRFFCASNPGGIGHNWVKKLWMDLEYEEGEMEADQFYFLPAKIMDNPHLDKSYMTQLEGLPKNLKRAYLEGNWDVFAGQYFNEWDKEKHIQPAFSIPFTWKKFRAYDHGREAPACCLWFAIDYDSRIWVYREYYETGKDVDEIAQDIIRLSEGEEYEYSVADPSIFHKLGFVDRYGGQTISETFARHGVAFYPASNRRVDGWTLMHQYLRWDKEKAPKIIFFPDCVNSIKTIPSLTHYDMAKQRSDKNVEDLDTRGEDHAADAVRYFLMSLHERQVPPKLNEVQRKLQQMKNQSLSLNNIYYGE